MIPQERSAAVVRALREAFGTETFDDISPLTRGFTSSLVFRIVVGGRPYALKMFLRESDMTEHFAVLGAASEAGVAPRVHYANAEERLFLSDFVDAAPLSPSEALLRVARLLRQVHALPAFHDAPPHLNTTVLFLLHPGRARHGFVKRFREAGRLPAREFDALFACYDRIASIYPVGDEEMVSCHNDMFNAGNILFDGTRLWLVDWEAAFRNDRYVDLTGAANHVAESEEEQRVFLREYFGRDADAYETARFFVLLQLSNAFYAMAFLLTGSAEGPGDTEVAPFREFQRRMWTGELDLANSHLKAAYGRAYLHELFRNTAQPRFEESLRVLAAAR
jgi:aminoglycoside phosphotransferase (APT) family kinase protein